MRTALCQSHLSFSDQKTDRFLVSAVMKRARYEAPVRVARLSQVSADTSMAGPTTSIVAFGDLL